MHPSSFQDCGMPLPPEWPRERLDSWKEVASFFRREVRTVQLWEKREGLPVRRQHHNKLGSIYAYRRELEQWWIARSAMNSTYGKQASQELHTQQAEAPTSSPETTAASYPRILALPFELVHTAADRIMQRQTMDRFIHSLRDELTAELARTQLHTIILPAKALPSPGTSSLSFMKTVAKEFSVDLFLSGTMRHSGNQIRVFVQLIDGSDLRCLWSDRFDCEQQGFLTSQSSLASRIISGIPQQTFHRAKLAPSEPSVTHSLAEQACRIGLHFWNQRSRATLMKAIGYFKDALEIDPQCALAYAGMANSYVSMSYNHLLPARQAAVSAYEAVQTAIKLDRSSLTVRNALINVLTNCTWEWSKAEQECKQLVDSGLMNGRTIQLYSSLMGSQGRHEEAISLALHAHRLEPLAPPVNNQVSLAYFYGGDYESALSFIRRTVELEPQYIMGYAMLGRIESERGNWTDAMAAFNRAVEVSNHSLYSQALLAYAHAGSGDAPRANEILNGLKSRSNDACFPAYDISAVHAILNQKEQALESLSRAYEVRDMKTIFIKQDPRFFNLRDTPGFHEIASSNYQM
jgi:TolB-like protein/tetratricopeptide (TPR) repeat protein